MTLSQFVTDNTNKAVTYDGLKENYGQCEQLVCLYWKDVLGYICPPIPAAVELWSNPHINLHFDHIPISQERQGDVAVFGASSLIGSPKYGHTDIVIEKTVNGFTGFDSNWGGVTDKHEGTPGYGYPAAHPVDHSYVDVLGFLRKKAAPATSAIWGPHTSYQAVQDTFGTTPAELSKLNPHLIKIGTEFKATQDKRADWGPHTSYDAISKSFKISYPSIEKLNPHLIKLGTKFRVK